MSLGSFVAVIVVFFIVCSIPVGNEIRFIVFIIGLVAAGWFLSLPIDWEKGFEDEKKRKKQERIDRGVAERFAQDEAAAKQKEKESQSIQ